MNPVPQNFSFANPWLLLLLLLIPVIAVLKGRIGGSPGITFSSTQSLAEIGQRRKSRAGEVLASLAFLAMAALVIAIAQPRLGGTVTHTQSSGVDIMLVVDVSGSMLAEDFKIGSDRANRVDVVKSVVEQFIRKRPSDNIGIIAFGGRPYLISPPTMDHDWLVQNLDRIKVGLVERSTAIGSAIVSAANRLKDKPGKSKIIVLLTDGVNNAGKVPPLTAAEAASTLGMKIYTIGAGTSGQVPYPFFDSFGHKFYQNVDSFPLDEETLKKIADMAHGKYFYVSDTDLMRESLNAIDKLEKTRVDIERITQYRDLFSYFLVAGFVFLSLEIALSQTVWKRLP